MRFKQKQPVVQTAINNALSGGGGGSGFTPTQKQLDAMNSGVDSTKVAQIEANKNNILTIQQTIGNINSVLEEVL